MARSADHSAPPLRLFVALELPDDVRDHLAAAAHAASEAAAGGDLRWSPKESWHLTLTFCGSVPAGRRPELEERLGRAAHRHSGLRLGIHGGGRFGNRVLWVGVGGDRERLSALAATVTAAARRTGIEVDDRPYRPHLTLARGTPGDDLRGLVAALRDYSGPTWVAYHVALVQSHLGAGPGRTARHETIRAWPLGGAAH